MTTTGRWMAVLGLAALLAVTVLLLQTRQPAPPAPEALSAAALTPAPPPTRPALMLTDPAIRQEFSPPATPGEVELRAFITTPLPAILRATLSRPRGAVLHITERVSVSPDRRYVVTVVPAALLKPGDYVLSLASPGTPRDVVAEFALRITAR